MPLDAFSGPGRAFSVRAASGAVVDATIFYVVLVCDSGVFLVGWDAWSKVGAVEAGAVFKAILAYCLEPYAILVARCRVVGVGADISVDADCLAGIQRDAFLCVL